MPRPSRTQDAVDQLLDAIIDGTLTAGEQLPPEGQLAIEFFVRHVARRWPRPRTFPGAPSQTVRPSYPGGRRIPSGCASR